MAKKLTVALAGNPNSGKTTLFNNLTGARQHVGNRPGLPSLWIGSCRKSGLTANLLFSHKKLALRAGSELYGSAFELYA